MRSECPSRPEAGWPLVPVVIQRSAGLRTMSMLRPVATMSTNPTTSGGALNPVWLFGRFDYPTSHRVLEVVSLAACGTIGSLFAYRALTELAGRLTVGLALAVVLAAVAAYAVADFLSGVVHYVFDTFGSPHTPVIGQKFVKPFRDHHDDPQAMTRGDFIAVNADNFFVCLPVLVPAFLLLDARRHPLAAVFLVALVVAVILTNQIHKWCHVDRAPAAVVWLQRHGVILSRVEHTHHHTAPFTTHHCITWGRMNPVLNRLLARRR